MRLFGWIMGGCLALASPAWAQQVPPPTRDSILVTGERNQARAKWVRMESPNFTVYGADEGEARAVTARLERFDQLLRILTGTPKPERANPLSIYLVSGTTQLDRLRRQRAQPGFFFTGYYSAAPTGMLVAADTRWDRLRDRVPRYHDVWLFTEYSRHFLLQNARGAYLPSWYVDGLSLNLATTRFDGDVIEYGKGNPSLAAALESRRWEPLRRIISGDLDHGPLYSAESALLVHYILAEPERGRAFGRYLAEVRAGADRTVAFETAFGASVNTLHDRLWRYKDKATYIRATATGFVAPEITVSRLPASADQLLLDQAAMRIGIVEADRQRAVLKRAEDAVADRSDNLARRVLAQAQILYGAPAAADPTLDALLALAPDDPELLYLKGMRHLMAGRADAARAPAEFREARKWLARVWRADPEYYPALYAWAEALSTEPQFVSENTLNVLLKAAQLAPQVTQIQVTAATMMLADGRFDAAAALLAPITVTPRDPASEQVPALLAQARAHGPADIAQLLAAFRTVAVWKDLNCC
ncbi:hypothetical protein P6144_10055 [Sphingomonas sp. HITSZ_GF]|uniref:hypothetical protein n=1 Tax=Sphingomonas sp. HITSZ_GF TaxID=3037247 RepID=UPI00240D2411|nr:hypothetical protein [Sphingomonas sp. HITSZ_GF]MDG2533989.1 hypothetical protein [Sphingomonas sp. HITSZ_GF]